jgi:hypothetical protein
LTQQLREAAPLLLKSTAARAVGSRPNLLLKNSTASQKVKAIWFFNTESNIVLILYIQYFYGISERLKKD